MRPLTFLNMPLTRQRQLTPTRIIRAGNKDAFPHHHPRFTINERALPIGIDTFTRTIERLLAAE